MKYRVGDPVVVQTKQRNGLWKTPCTLLSKGIITEKYNTYYVVKCKGFTLFPTEEEVELDLHEYVRAL